MHLVEFEARNFQSLEKVVVNLTDGINVFVGTSNAGKSAILRGIKWNLRNQPAGDEFIKLGTKEAYTRTKWSDGHEVIRVRSKGGSKNFYTLMKDGEVIQEFTGFGTDVPPLIQEITGVDPKMDFNFANQLEAPFLLSDSPKVRAETIGNLEELAKVDLALTELNDDMKMNKKSQKEKSSELAALEKERNELMNSLLKDKNRVETLRVLKESLIEKEKLVTELEKIKPRFFKLQDEYTLVKNEVERSTRILEKWNEDLPLSVENVSRLMQSGKRLIEIKSDLENISFMQESKIEQLEELTEIITKLTASYQRIVQLGNQFKRTQEDRQRIKESFSGKTASLDMSFLDKEVERFTALFHLKNRFHSVKAEQANTESEIKVFNDKVNILLDDFVQALQETETCPTCYQSTQEVDKEVIQEAI